MNFIEESFLDEVDVCDQIIDYYKRYDNKHCGTVSGKVSPTNDQHVKKCTQISVHLGEMLKDDHLFRYFCMLEKSLTKYKQKYSFVDFYTPWQIVEKINIQYYKPGEAFYAYHTERASNLEPYSSRHLVFMTYLNDVYDGGETEFYYQKLKVTPQKGKTLIWPVDWTHTHRGIPSYTEEKYILTGWFSFITKETSS
jgi:hypothetical protein